MLHTDALRAFIREYETQDSRVCVHRDHSPAEIDLTARSRTGKTSFDLALPISVHDPTSINNADVVGNHSLASLMPEIRLHHYFLETLLLQSLPNIRTHP